MKNKLVIIILFAIQALGLVIVPVAGIMLLFFVANSSQINWSQLSDLVQSVAALITMILGVLYIVTYIFSLSITIANKKVSFISWLPFLHGVVALIFWGLWVCSNQLYG